MSVRAQHRMEDRILLSRAGRAQAARGPSPRRAYWGTLAGGLLGAMAVLWMMAQLGQASSEPKSSAAQSPAFSAEPMARPQAASSGVAVAETEEDEKSLAPPASATQGPGLDEPREVIGMLDLRKRDLDRREEAIRKNEERLLIVRAEIEQLLSKNEAAEKRLQAERAKQAQQAANEKTLPPKGLIDRDRQAQQQTQLAKMYESMAAEDAAARLDRMSDRKAIEILRLVKGKTAGAILSQLKVDRAAKLTEQLLVPAP